MFKIRAVQAAFGDCLILEYGTAASRRWLLIDGGPPDTYDRHLRGELEKISDAGGKLDLAVVSHVDNDHVIGMLDLFAELRASDQAGSDALIGVEGLWHNAFAKAIGGDIQSRLAAMVAAAGAQTMDAGGVAVNGISEGNKLRIEATGLGTPINDGFPTDLICVDDAPPPFSFGNLTLQVVGPTKANLDALKDEWEEWLDEHEDEAGDPFLAAMADQSIPNLSSIQLLATAHGKRVLLTGDGRGDHLLDGLAAATLLDANGSIDVDVLKVPHHGSDRNVTKTFFKKVRAKEYLISADGKHGNPDTSTLIWLVEAAKSQNRRITIHVTNATPSTKKIVEEYPPADFGYTLKTMPKNRHSMTLALAD